MSFLRTQDFMTAMAETSSVLDKVQILEAADFTTRRVLYWTYNKYKQFHVGPDNIKKRKDLVAETCDYLDLFDLLEDLNGRVITGHDAISQVNAYIRDNPENEELVHLILDRNLKIRASEKLINRACDNLIPTFDVALAASYDEKMEKKVDFERQSWMVSRKLDGVRCLVIVDENGKATSWARSGKQFQTLQKVEEEIESLGMKSVVFDGEMCILDENGDEDFQNCMKQIRRKDHTITNGLYQTFDLIDLPDFQQGTSDDTFFTRLGRLRDVVGDDAKMISVLHQEQISDNDHFQEWRQRSQDADWEGLMLRLDVPYKGKRSKDILKVKLMHDAEYRVKDTAFGPFRYVVSGREVEEEMLSAVMIEHRGNTVRVGSGFTIEQRQHYFKHPEDIVGKIITTQYFEETKSQQGTFSLRFPVVKVIHGDEREC
jgi:DNA ligase 1